MAATSSLESPADLPTALGTSASFLPIFFVARATTAATRMPASAWPSAQARFPASARAVAPSAMALALHSATSASVSHSATFRE